MKPTPFTQDELNALDAMEEDLSRRIGSAPWRRTSDLQRIDALKLRRGILIVLRAKIAARMTTEAQQPVKGGV